MSLTWNQSNAPVKDWRILSSSSDGTKLAATGFGCNIYISTDSGITWTNSNNSPFNYWTGLTSSSDGTKLAACSGGGVYTSTDSGLTWTNINTTSFSGITSNSDGTKLAAYVSNGEIYTSTNSGVNWTKSNSPALAWYCITSNSDGTKLAAGTLNGKIYTSTDSGINWSNSNNSPVNYWNAITSSSDGTKLAAVIAYSKIYTSTDSGITWSNSNDSLANRWGCITSSSDGINLTAAAGAGVAGDIYISTNGGSNWTKTSAPSGDWRFITSSSDGKKLAGVISMGNIYSGSIISPPCFREGSLILTDAGYKPIQDLRKGDLVKTLNNGFLQINMIGKSVFYHSASSDRVKDQLYKCSQDNYSEIFEPLVITGCHSILVDNFHSEKQKETVVKVVGDTYVTDNKYRLPAFADLRASVYETPGNYTIYHLALDNDDYYMNYGIYANGLLVETCSKRYLKEISNMTLI